MLLAGLLTVAVGIPAQASELEAYNQLPQAAVQAAVEASLRTSEQAPTPVVPAAGAALGQSLTTSTAASAALQRDGFTVTDAPKPVPVPVAVPVPVIAMPAAAPAAVAAAPAPAAGGAVQWPFPGSVAISGPYGPREAPCDGCSTFHKGLDLIPGEGTPVHVVADGVVREVSATDNGGFGVHAIVDHIIDGQLVSSVYAHFQAGSLRVSPGQAVSVGTELGNVGSTGQSTGPHLHFEILLDGVTPTDPYVWLTQRAGPM